MFQRGGEQTALPLLLKLRRGVEDLGELSGTYRLGAVIGDDYHPSGFSEYMVWLVGSWLLPPFFPPSRDVRYVNPNYKHRHLYTDIAVKCNCGAIVRSTNSEEHGDCRQDWRDAAREQLRSKQVEWLENAAYLYLSLGLVADRMAVEPEYVTELCQELEIDWHARRMDGRERAARTWKRLHDEYEYQWTTIAEAFGVNSGTVRTYARGQGVDIDL